MSSDRAPESHSANTSNTGDQNDPAHADIESSGMMKRILEATLLRQTDRLAPEEWSTLQRVAREMHERRAGMVELAEALVWELCVLRFRDFDKDEKGRAVCQRIARTLAGDPYAKQRLIEFQQYLLTQS